MQLLDEFGEKYGIIFQIRDDIFDFISTSSKIGKPVGNDIHEGKFTLPLIYAYTHASATEQNEIKKIYQNKDFSDENVKKVVDFAIGKGGIEYAEKRIIDFKIQAEKILENFEDNEAKKALENLLNYSIQRKY